MSIRVNPNSARDLLAALALDQQQQKTALQQLSTGRDVNQLSDNPAAATDVVFTHIQNSRDDQYLQNISDLTSQLQTADSALSSVVTAVTRAISLGVEGANGNLTGSDQQSIASQVSGILDQVVSLANQTYNGVYLFAGTNSTTQPFVLDATQPDGVQYNGNAGVNSIGISNGNSIAINAPGSQLFTNANGNLVGSLNALVNALQTNTGVGNAVTNLQTAFSEFSTQRVFYGNALQQLSSTQNVLNGDKTQAASQENSLIRADMAVAATNLSQASVATSAVLSATNQILSTLNLLDYLR